MRSAINTFILAAAGAAVIVATPALAKTRHVVTQYDPPATVQYQDQLPSREGVVAPIQGDTFNQIRDEYLKDGPSHNGNGY